MENKELPYIELTEFNERFEDYAKENWVLKNLRNHNPKFSWEDLPKHLIQELFEKLGAKPIIQKY